MILAACKLPCPVYGSRSTIYNFEVALSDLNRDLYQQLTLRVARHSSELVQGIICKVLAYCLEFSEFLQLSKGLDDPGMPAIWAKDLTGQITQWIEIGSPSPEKLHKASKSSPRVAIYTYKHPSGVLQQYSGEKIHRAAEIPLFSFAVGFLGEVATVTDKRNIWSLTISEDQVYLEVGSHHFASPVLKHSLETGSEE